MSGITMSPQVRLYISTNRPPELYNAESVKLSGNHYYNVSKDIISGDINLVYDQCSSATFELANTNGRYTNAFDKLDRCTIYLGTTPDTINKVMTGYILEITEGKRREDTVKITIWDTLYNLVINYFDPCIDYQITGGWSLKMPKEMLELILHNYGGIFAPGDMHILDDFSPSDSERYKLLMTTTSKYDTTTTGGGTTGSMNGPAAATLWASSFDSITTDRLVEFLKGYESPLANATTMTILKMACDTYNISPALVIAIAGKESTFGKYGEGPPVFNAWGYKDASGNGWSVWDSWDNACGRYPYFMGSPDSIYRDKTIEEMATSYCPGTSQEWAKDVISFYYEITGETQPTSTTSPSSTSAYCKPLGDVTVWDAGYTPGTTDDHGPSGHGCFKASYATDIGSSGMIVYSCFDGVVTECYPYTSSDGQYRDYTVVVENGTNLAVYAHITPSTAYGANVKKGQVLGRVSPVLNSPHLHFECILNGISIMTGDMAAIFSGAASPNAPGILSQYLGPMSRDWALVVEGINSGYGNIPLKYMNDVSVFRFLLEAAKWGKYCITTDPDGRLLAKIPVLDYDDKYIISVNSKGEKNSGRPTIHIDDIRITDFKLTWSDQDAISHVYCFNDVVNAYYTGRGPIGKENLKKNLSVIGAASVVSMEQFLGDFNKNVYKDRSRYASAVEWLEKFGIRPLIVQGDESGWCKDLAATQFYAEYVFLQKWAAQTKASLSTTFIPQLRPLQNVYIPCQGMAFHVESVTHSFSTTMGFETRANLNNARYYGD